MMRVLTVRQPWAWAIIHGGKDVENRTRNVAGSYRGPVAIHAALREDEAGWSDPTFRQAWAATSASKAIGRFYRPLSPSWAHLGEIIGVVDLVDTHPVFDCITQQRDGDWTVCSEWAERSGHHLVFSNPRPLETPVPFRGGLSLRHLDEATTADVMEQIGGTA